MQSIGDDAMTLRQEAVGSAEQGAPNRAKPETERGISNAVIAADAPDLEYPIFTKVVS